MPQIFAKTDKVRQTHTMDKTKPNSPKRANATILQVLPGLDSGGVERTAVDIAHALDRAGWTSLVASQGGRLEAELPKSTRHINLPLASKNPLTIAANIKRLRQVIAEHNVDLVHARSRAPAWSALYAAKREKVPFITTYHGIYSQNNRAKALYNSAMVRGDVVIANSAWTAEIVAQRHPNIANKIIPIGRGTDFHRFDPAKVTHEQKRAKRQSWGLDNDDFALLLLGRLTPIKGHMDLVEAAAILLPNHPNLKLIFVGNPDDNPNFTSELKARIAALGLKKHVIFPGLSSTPELDFAAADCAAMVSGRPEAFGRTAVEAAAMERIALVTDHGGAKETVIGAPLYGFTGWKVPPGDTKALATGITEIMALSYEEREQIGKRARLRAQGKFSLQRMCTDTLQVYADCIAKHS